MLAILFLTIVHSAAAQSLVEELGGVKTNFRIISDTTELPIQSQAIVWRGVKKVDKKQTEWVDSDYASAHSSAYGYGYGLRALHLEFMTSSGISKVSRNESNDGIYFELKLFDKEQQLLFKSRMSRERMKLSSNKSDLKTFSLNLMDVPLILLEETDAVSIALVIAQEEKKGKTRKRK